MKIITRNDWRTKPMPIENVEFEVNRTFTEKEIEILRIGLKPREMEDKWFCFMEEDTMYFHRSWTGFCIFIVEFDFINNIHRVIANRDENEIKFLEVDYLKERVLKLINNLIIMINMEYNILDEKYIYLLIEKSFSYKKRKGNL